MPAWPSTRAKPAVCSQSSRVHTAALLTGAFEGLCERYGRRPPAALEQFPQGRDPFPAAHAALGDEDFQAAVARGRRMWLDEAVALIVELGDAMEDATTVP